MVDICVADGGIIFIVTSGADYRAFLHLDALYLEPQLSGGQVRVFVYVNTKICGPIVAPTAGKPLPNALLDGSM